MQERKKKQSRFHPDLERARNIQLQERDFAILRQVMEDRFLSAQHLTALFFPSEHMAKKRLNKLWNAGFLKRDFAPVSFGHSPAIYCLTAKGRDILLTHGVVQAEEMNWHKDRNRGTSPFKQHELEVNDVKTALTVASRDSLDIEELLFDRGTPYYDQVVNRERAKGEKPHIPIRPDGFIAFRNQDGLYIFFLEVDRGTMKLSRLRTKLKGYRLYYFDGGFFAKYGEDGRKKEEYSFRMLMTCPTEKTRNNRLELAASMGSNTMMWFGVQSEVVANPLGNVWIRGKEYKEAMQLLSPEEEQCWANSHNKQERDLFIREHVQLQSILS